MYQRGGVLYFIPSYLLPDYFLIHKKMPKFSSDFYESILKASDKGELWGIENTDLTPLEIQLILSHTTKE
tara:strand:+ start:254 stop:463 length:210 start_codon:yes stop_codon:yes gene_type:complete